MGHNWLVSPAVRWELNSALEPSAGQHWMIGVYFTGQAVCAGRSPEARPSPGSHPSNSGCSGTQRRNGSGEQHWHVPFFTAASANK